MQYFYYKLITLWPVKWFKIERYKQNERNCLTISYTNTAFSCYTNVFVRMYVISATALCYRLDSNNQTDNIFSCTFIILCQNKFSQQSWRSQPLSTKKKKKKQQEKTHAAARALVLQSTCSHARVGHASKHLDAT